MATVYTNQQQVFCLNRIAGAPANRLIAPEDLQEYAKCVVSTVLADSDVQSYIGRWELVWGPVVFCNKSSQVADNTMFVARGMNGNTPQYVVSIAGTNPISWYDWFVEDFSLLPPEDFKTPNGNQGKVSHGTYVGVTHLQEMTDSGKTLNDCLRAAVKANNALEATFTGHSLGGALSPTLALIYRDLQGQQGAWDPDSRATVSVLFTAGPTPGNDSFSRYFDSRFGDNATRIWNSIDVVPHAWKLDQMAELPFLYAPHIEPNVLLDAVVDIAKANSKSAGKAGCVMTPLCPDQNAFSGTYNPNLPPIREFLQTREVKPLLERVGEALNLSDAVIAALQKLADKVIMDYGDQKPSGISELMARAVEDLHEDFAKLDIEASSQQLGILLSYLIQAAWQHTAAYPQHIGIDEFEDRMTALVQKCK
jgi:hypothetical protein